MPSLILLKKRLRVLVVDADPDSRELLKVLFEEVLEDCEAEVIEASSAGAALQIMQQTRPDLLICELLLPDEDGYMLIDRVKQFEVIHRTSIPVIALTVCAMESDRLRALTAGFCRHLTKPLDIDLLMDTVA